VFVPAGVFRSHGNLAALTEKKAECFLKCINCNKKYVPMAIVGGLISRLHRQGKEEHGMLKLSSLCLGILIFFAGVGKASDLTAADAARLSGNYAQAVRIYEALARSGNLAAQISLGGMYELGSGVSQNFQQAGFWYRKAADQNDPWANRVLADLYRDGRGFRQDMASAAVWYRKAADLGDVLAKTRLGDLYRIGRGIDQDLRQAAFWYREAASQGDAIAQFRLANMYRQGHGILQDWEQAAFWYSKSADQGLALAQASLAVIYESGIGVPVDLVEAHKWYNIVASSAEDPSERAEAAADRDELARRMTREQISTAQARARTWRPEPGNSAKDLIDADGNAARGRAR